MNPEIVVTPEFVEYIPDELVARTLYIAAKYRTVVHLCCCGCGRKVVTPLSPAAWRLTFDGVSVTLHPSVGNWNLPCRSHYWIDRNRVRWESKWTASQIDAGRAAEAAATANYYGERNERAGPEPQPKRPAPVGIRNADEPTNVGFWGRLWRRLFG